MTKFVLIFSYPAIAIQAIEEYIERRLKKIISINLKKSNYLLNGLNRSRRFYFKRFVAPADSFLAMLWFIPLVPSTWRVVFCPPPD